MSTSQGLPYLHFWDEPLLGTGAINALKRGNIFPNGIEAIYGGFLRYTAIIIDAIYFQYLKFTDPAIYSISNIQTPMDGLEHAVSHSGFYHLNRIYVSLLDTLGFVFLFLVGKPPFPGFSGGDYFPKLAIKLVVVLPALQYIRTPTYGLFGGVARQLA